MKNQMRVISLKKWFISPLPDSGSILIVTVWTLLFLSSFCVTLGYIVHAKLNTAGHIKDRVIAHYLAKAGIQAAIQVLADDRTEYDSLNDTWSNNEQFFREIELGSGVFTVSYHAPCPMLYAQETMYGLIDEERKININAASGDILASLLIMSGCPDSTAGRLADCIIDWRDEDSEPLGRGAEDGYYNSLEISYNCKDADFESTEELLLVKGITDEIFSGIKHNLTVFGDGGININTAGKDVLIAAGMGAALAEKIINYRAGIDGIEATLDDGIFEDSGEIKEKLSLSEIEEEIIDSLVSSGLIAVSSDNFRVVSRGKLNNAPVSSKIICVIDREEAVKHWQQD
ncbi:MAG: general secretion pathway protein GspK [Candidatus Omnitrophota bacterium]|nr:general secretion pathway protein GspK [Candidatus Omnitrophota bacterium]